MRKISFPRNWYAGAALTALIMVAAPTAAGAECSKDIDKVEYAVDHSEREGIDITVAERMRALLEEANKERKAGNEAKCQELIDQAKAMGGVE
ncbi:hypothetical protein [Roseibium sediminicola]|uniref:Uncharacterized protein n=1 Tax=Roseibium sediminicola TaxID=2933272 RepID=A0ABT0GYU7_9HYPH|nr:hypothetical protein [Roseibium sp. CAU 1639]MCK7614501.1 hypothetical protein [Roseibium sp. CAU 1639]